jgi:hypothetical protein
LTSHLAACRLFKQAVRPCEYTSESNWNFGEPILLLGTDEEIALRSTLVNVAG